LIDKWFIYVFPCGNFVLIRKISGIGLNHEIKLLQMIVCTNSKKKKKHQNKTFLLNFLVKSYLVVYQRINLTSKLKLLGEISSYNIYIIL
jgi:DNA polymerase/3'-5' exonuclease PolX